MACSIVSDTALEAWALGVTSWCLFFADTVNFVVMLMVLLFVVALLLMFFQSFSRSLSSYDNWSNIAVHIAMDLTIVEEEVRKFASNPQRSEVMILPAGLVCCLLVVLVLSKLLMRLHLLTSDKLQWSIQLQLLTTPIFSKSYPVCVCVCKLCMHVSMRTCMCVQEHPQRPVVKRPDLVLLARAHRQRRMYPCVVDRSLTVACLCTRLRHRQRQRFLFVPFCFLCR